MCDQLLCKRNVRLAVVLDHSLAAHDERSTVFAIHSDVTAKQHLEKGASEGCKKYLRA